MKNLTLLTSVAAMLPTSATTDRVKGMPVIIPQLAPYKIALPLDVKPKCSLLVGPFSLVS